MTNSARRQGGGNHGGGGGIGEARPPAWSVPDFLQRVRGANALDRIGTVEEIGQVVVFLASDQASCGTGEHRWVGGGFTAVRRL